MKHVFRQWLAGLLSVVLLFTLLPAAALAEEADGATETAVEQVQTLIDALPDAEEITIENRADVQAQIDAIDTAMLELTEDQAAALDTARHDAAAAALLALDAPSALEQVQALIDALPDAEDITEENRADVEEQLNAIDEAKQELDDEEIDQLDTSRYMAAVEAILALDDMAGANEPETMDTDLNVENEPVNINTGGNYTITGSTTSNTITVNGGDVTITLKNVSVTSNGGCAFDIQSGNVTLILEDGTTNSFTSAGNYAGIRVAEGASLTIRGNGTLNATAKKPSDNTRSGAGIGGNYNSNAGSITIESGTIFAKSEGDGAGIGGGHTDSSGKYAKFQSITISGGKVTAEAGGNGAGIGCGCWATTMGTITISGGEIHAKSTSKDKKSFDIGYGHRNSDFTSNITISGGVVFTEGSHGRGIGAKTVNKNNCLIFPNSGEIEYHGSPTITGDITIPSGKTLTVPNGSTLTVAEGATLTNEGSISNNGKIVISDTGILENKDKIRNSGNIVISGTGKLNNVGTITNITNSKDKGKITGTVTGTQPVTIEGASYLDWDQSAKRPVKKMAPVDPVPVTSESTTWETGWYVVNKDVKILNRVTVSGDVKLILADGCTLTTEWGIRVEGTNSLTIYGQEGRTGKLISPNNPNGNTYSGVYGGASIGADGDQPTGNITINCAYVEATTTKAGGACIGSGGWDSTGGTVTANGAYLKLQDTGSGYGSGEGAFGVATVTLNDCVIEFVYGRMTQMTSINNASKTGLVLTKKNTDSNMTGTVYGNATLWQDYTIPSDATLTVTSGNSLTVPDGVTLHNGGTINNEGHVYKEEGGTITGNSFTKAWEAPPVYLTITEFSYEVPYGDTTAKNITIKNTGALSATINNVTVTDGEFEIVTGNYTSIDSGNTDTSWKIKPKTVLTAGEHTATITVIYSGQGVSSKTTTAEVTFTVTQATPAVNVSVSGTLVYGSDITLTAEVTAPGVVINDDVTFKAGNVELGKAQAENGKATLVIKGTDTDKQKDIFDNNEITAEYAGNDNIEKSTGTKTVTIKPKTLTYTVTAEGREYDGGETVEVALKPEGLVGSDDVTLTATGNLEKADAGTYETVNLSDIAKGGDDERYYSVDRTAEGKELQGGGVTIKPLVVEIEWMLDGGKTFTVDYNGAAHIATAEVSNKVNSDDVSVTVQVTPQNGAEATDAITVGSYTATATVLTGAAANNYTLAGCDNTEQRFTIQKVAASDTTEPTAKDDLTYSGTEQALVTEGSTTGGTVMYALGDESQAPAEYSNTVPTGTNAGTYYVWWKVVGDANHNDTEPKPITVTIDKAEGTGSVTMENYFCLQEGVNPEPKSDTNGTDNVKYTYAKRGEEVYSETKPTTAGEYTVKAEFAATDNYNSFTETADFTIYHHFDGWEAEGDGYQNTCPCDTGVRLQETGLEEVPTGLRDKEDLNTVDKITQVLAEEVRKDTSIPETNTAVYDVKLQIKSVGSDWEEVDEENFPEDGITVILPYPEGTNSSYTFTVIHMITTVGNAGQTEKLEPTNGEDGISFTVKSLSPICVGWTAPPSSSSSYYNVTIPSDFEGGSVTSDRTSVRSGSKVTLTVKPDEGYHFGSLTVTNRNGKPVELTDNGDGTYTFTMPYSQVTVDAEFVKCGSLDFNDLDASAWYHDYTDYVIAHGLMQGTGGGLFAPDGTVNRAQMVTVLWNMSGKPVVNYYMTYSDVSEEAWYAEPIRWATSEGIAAGYGGGLFGPNDPISREQMAAMMYRYEQKYGEGGFTGDWMYRLPFTDLDQISDWAFEAVAWCNMKGVMSGKDDDIFDPKGPAKRSELAAVLTRFCGEETDEE